MERESVGIKGIDEMIQGGLPKDSITSVSGPPGVGKSIFALHFLLEGARKGQKGVYVCLEEPRTNIDNMINNFSFSKEFYSYEKKGLIVIKCFNYQEYSKVSFELLEKIKEDLKIKRVVIDSFNCFFDYMGGSSKNSGARKFINDSFFNLRRDNLNILLILESSLNPSVDLDYSIPYLVDGIIKLDYLDMGVIERRVFIPKMRWTNQFKESKGYEIGGNGIIVLDESID